MMYDRKYIYFSCVFVSHTRQYLFTHRKKLTYELNNFKSKIKRDLWLVPNSVLCWHLYLPVNMFWMLLLCVCVYAACVTLINGKGMQIKSIKGVGISSGSNKYEHDDAMEEKTMNVFCDSFSLALRLRVALFYFFFLLLHLKVYFSKKMRSSSVTCVCECVGINFY